MENAQEIFFKACEKVFDCWTALNLAVENNWGGDDSVSKKELLVRNMIEFCFQDKEIYKDEIEDILVDKLDKYFNVNLEDASEVEIASILVKLRETCLSNDFTFANDLIANLRRSSNPSVSAHESSSDEEDTNKTKSRGPKMITDEDGWTTVL